MNRRLFHGPSGPASWPQLLDFDATVTGAQLHQFVRDYLDLPRSITGDGVRATLAGVASAIPLDVHEVPTGTTVLGWTVPNEWNVRAARLTGPDGTVLADLADSPMAVLGYSTPIDRHVSLEELRPHLFTEPAQPDAIPYRTSFYKENWGFSVPENVVQTLVDGDYHAVIDSTLAPGSLTYAEFVLPGESQEEFLLSAHTCHPGLANDNMAGIALAVALAQALSALPSRRLTYRIVFCPSTIGAITWLAQHREHALANVVAGLVITCVGDPGPLTYKRSRPGGSTVDLAAEHVLSTREGATVHDFFPWGYDERQYGSPGFNLPVGCLMRTPHGGYPEYHTSNDNADFITADAMADSLRTYLEVIAAVDGDAVYRNTQPFGEPKLGDYDLYPSTGGFGDIADLQLAIMWVLNASDGTQGLLTIARRAGMPFAVIREAADRLERVGLIVPA